jgi:extracellular elastinolytic metalloproteinase
VPRKLPGLILVLSAAIVALVLVPGSLSAAEDGSADLALDTALDYVSDNASDLGVTSADVADLFVTSQYTSSHNGITHVNLGQRYQGLEVFGGYVTVNVDAAGRVVFASGSLVSNLASAAGARELGAAEAVEAAADSLDLGEPSDLEVSASGGQTVVSDGGISDAPIPAKLGWQPTKSGLRLAWDLVIDSSSDISLWNAAVDAETGDLLNADDWTIEDEHEDLAATLTGGSVKPPPPPPPPARGFTLDPVDDGSCYRVYDLALESPNDGDRRLVCNPADALASPFGWHDTNGAVGPEFTITRGNNNHAYLDQDANNAPDAGLDTDGGAGLQFDFPADLAEHSQNYRDAVTTNLFFHCNAFHDVLYIRGWTEPAGNFQANNYGRGGTQGDYVRCEAADGGGTNNANFSTPAETAASGGTPRMQMFLWPGPANQNQVVVDGVGTFNGSWARFGAAPFVAGTSGAIFDAGNGCTAANYAGAPAGDFIAIVIGGASGCTNPEKARQAGAAGAKAIIIAHNATGAAPILTGAQTTPVPNIPVISITQADGNTIRAALPANGTVRKNPAHPGIRDGDFENGIIWHEYGHGMSIRLTGGPATNCLSGDEQQGEGWSDYVANVAMIDPDLDDPEGPRGMGPYALFQPNRQGNGIRPRPYSRTFTIQPFTYDSIRTNGWLNNTSLAVPHGIGHGWAAILWHMTWDLIDKHGFGSNIYANWDAGGNNRAMQYMVDGLKLQGCSPNFITSRNAILAAANTLGGGAPGQQAGDSCTIWGSFAIRGAGFGAAGGGTSRNDGTESFTTHPNCRDDFSSPALLPYGQLNQADPGKAMQFKVNLGGYRGDSQLATVQYPFSRRVNCTTLAVPAQGTANVTPREYPIPADSSDGLGFKYKYNEGVYQFNWQTDDSWLGTCREFVLQVKDGTQYRAYFRFLYPFDGFLQGVESPPALNAASAKNVRTLYWKIGGDRGLDSVAAGFPRTRAIDCTTLAPTGAFEPAATPSWDSLGYQAHLQRYYFPWQPPKGNVWAGTCREFQLGLKDGQLFSAYFRFT